VKNRTLTIALWTSSLGVFAYLFQRMVRRRRRRVDVGTVSDDWLAHHRGIGPDESW